MNTNEKNGKKPDKLKTILTGIAIVIAGLITLFTAGKDILNGSDVESGANSYTINTSCEVHIIDVGQGDSIFVRCGSKNILIDGGENGMDTVVTDYLTAQQVTKLDLIIATHPHSDHIGGLDTVIYNFDVDKIMMPQIADSLVPTSVAYERLLNAVEKRGVQYETPKTGNSYSFDGVEMLILDDGSQGETLNNCSIVVKFVCGENAFLLMGDAEKKEEQRIMATGLDVSADVIKLGHHGSYTATGEDFYDLVNPTYAALSLGADNDYGYPHRETKALLKEKGTTYYRTDLVSDIVFKSDGKNVTVSTAK